MAINLQEHLARDIFFNGVYEPVTAAVIAHLLQPGDVFFDVGANQGQFSLLAARMVGDGGAVYSFEPNGAVRRLLNQSIGLNGFGNVHVEDAACMGKSGSFELQLDERTGNAFGGAKTVERISGSGGQTVRGITLDEYVAEKGIGQIDLLKMDIEGGEAGALLGMVGMLDRRTVKNLIIEFHPDLGLPGGREGMKSIAAHIVSAGYTQKQLHEFPAGIFSHYLCEFSDDLLYDPSDSGSMREVGTPQYLFTRTA
jgi:FkbM family methyltransferase